MNQYDHQHTVTYGNPNQWGVVGNIYNPLYVHEYPPKEPTMSTIDKIAAERKEAKEKARLEAAFAAWDELGIDDWVHTGTIARFAWTPKDKTYIYAAVKTDIGWFVTGREATPRDTDGLIKFLVERDIEPDEVEWFDVDA